MDNEIKIQELKETILEAFKDTPYPKGKITNMGDDEGVSKYFSGTENIGHTVINLRYHEVALVFFEPEAFRYFLPAFMLAELEDPEEADVIADGILFVFGELRNLWECVYEKRLSLFTEGEKNAIAAFISYLNETYDDGFEDDSCYALSRLRD